MFSGDKKSVSGVWHCVKPRLGHWQMQTRNG